jgi:hypothetical protein
MKNRIVSVKIMSRVALGLVWVYEGLIPKLFFLRTDELDLVQKSGLVWRTPQLTLQLLGLAQIVTGIWLLIGWKERSAVAVATAWMAILIVLVGAENPAMLTDPYGALVKDLCLIACAITVWALASPPKSIRSVAGN